VVRNSNSWWPHLAIAAFEDGWLANLLQFILTSSADLSGLRALYKYR
jgi:hypothetical protein